MDFRPVKQNLLYYVYFNHCISSSRHSKRDGFEQRREGPVSLTEDVTAADETYSAAGSDDLVTERSGSPGGHLAGIE